MKQLFNDLIAVMFSGIHCHIDLKSMTKFLLPSNSTLDLRNLLVAVTKKVVKVKVSLGTCDSFEFDRLFCGFVKCITGHRSLRLQLFFKEFAGV